MAKPLVIVYGYSDASDTFSFLSSQLLDISSTIITINLANYFVQDDMDIDDLALILKNVWNQQGISEDFRSVNLIAHSVTALVIRRFLQRYYSAKTAPIEHLVFLAPANFGTTIAHKGNAFLGRVLHGFSGKKPFIWGKKLQSALELGSAFGYSLAQVDRFGKDNIYKEGSVLCTTLIGNAGFEGIAAAANTYGSDGVVPVSSANMHCAQLTIDFTKDADTPRITYKTSKGTTGFGVLHGENHFTITGKDDSFKNPMTLEFIKEALTIDDDGFSNFCKKLSRVSEHTMEYAPEERTYNGFQNLVTLLQDDYQRVIEDYFVELYENRKDDNWISTFIQNEVIESVHTHTKDSGFKSFLCNASLLEKNMDEISDALYMRVFATPTLENHQNVGYKTFLESDMVAAKFDIHDIKRYFKTNRTLFITMTIRRELMAIESQNITSISDHEYEQ